MGGRRSGFTIIEVAFALAILALVIVGALAALGSASRLREVHRERTVALAAAASKLDEAFAADFQTVATAWNGSRFAAPPLVDASGSADVGTVSVTVEQDLDPATDQDDILLVEARVEWTGVAGGQALAVQARVSRRR